MIKLPPKLWMIVFLALFAGQKAMSQDSVHNEQGLVIAADSISENKIVNDSISAKSDTINKKKSAIDAPVNIVSKDSMIMVMDSANMLYLYKDASIKYKDINLSAEHIEMDADKSELYAYFGLDSVGAKFGFPVFKSGDSQDTEMEQVWYNFNTKKMFTKNVITQQGEGYITAEVAKKMPDDSYFMENGKYTTCDIHDHPHFYFNLTKAKIRPGKNIVTGPVYLVVEDVPLPIAAPFFFFPSTKSYSSGIIMPAYGDEMARGFNLHGGGYYFAFSDYVDLALTGEIYTKGSWGLSARSNYIKKYKYSGGLDASYLVTITGDKDTKNMANSDYSKSTDIRISWNHRQDAKANPYGTFTARVDFSTSSYYHNDFSAASIANMSQNTKASSVSYAYRSPAHPQFSINTSFSVNQRSQDSTLTVSLPDMTISLTNIYPFKRKEQVGSDRWYEKIYLSYTGTIRNSISNVKEGDFFHKNLIKDWKNGIKHSIPISASFNLFKYLTLSTSFNYNENWYSNRVNYDWNYGQQMIAPVDTTYGFYRTYDYNASISLNTKLYGTYKPMSFLGKWTKGVIIRHVLTPSVSFSGAPDFSNPSYGMYKNINYINSSLERMSQLYSIYQNQIFGGPSTGRTGAVNFSLDNNLEMKVPIAGTDSAKKISLIDNLGLRMSYNFLADSLNWSNLSASIRLKILNSTLNLQGMFDTYLYDENGRHINVPRWKAGKGIGRFMGTSTGYSYSFNNDTFKKLFGKGDKDSGKKDEATSSTNQEGDENTEETTESGGSPKPHTSLLAAKKQEGNYDSNGYLISDFKWNFSFNYNINLGYGTFNQAKLEYDYRISQTLGFNGDISPTKSWKVSFNASYDFDVKRIVSMYCTISRQMHCWSMSASVVPIGPYQNYSFTIAINSSLLQDFKYQQSSNYRDALNWGN